MSTRPTALNTKKEYGMIIFVPTKKKKWHEQRHDRILFKGEQPWLIFPRGFKQVSLPDGFAQTSWANWKVLRLSIKVLKSLSKKV
jgi:hypothetical protein